jgi:branched-chain amino acid transport system permease protein
VLLEILRPSTVAALLSWLPANVFDALEKYFIDHLGVLRMIIMPLLLVLVMIYWPRGIMGKREFRGFVPRRDKDAHRVHASIATAAGTASPNRARE